MIKVINTNVFQQKFEELFMNSLFSQISFAKVNTFHKLKTSQDYSP